MVGTDYAGIEAFVGEQMVRCSLGQAVRVAAAEMNRYNHIQMFVDQSAADVRVDGSFRTTNAAGFIRLIKEGFGVDAVRNGDEIIFIKKK